MASEEDGNGFFFDFAVGLGEVIGGSAAHPLSACGAKVDKAALNGGSLPLYSILSRNRLPRFRDSGAGAVN
jgi:hypothetical protein